MNLLEYCVFSATNRVDRKTKSLVFEDPVFCDIEKRQLTRRLTIAFSAEYGRPTARDDLVLVAMMKKSRDEGFNSQRVHFTRYELLKILGWPENGQNYERIDQALNRIIGTHLVWDNAFWDNSEKSWVDRKFSIIDDVNLYDREKYDRARERRGESRPQSWFKWSDVMFESFQAGYVKSIDLELLRSLNENVSKRLYRWLDKHFNNKKRKMPLEIPIATLAGRKLGFQNAPASHLQRMLAPAIAELEAVSYLAPEAMRFVGSGKKCVVRFRPVRKKNRISDPILQKLDVENPPLGELATKLHARGLSAKAAEEWAAKDPEQAKLQLEHLDWLLSTDWKPEKGEGAWLSAALKGRYTPPAAFNKKAEAERESIQAKRQRASREQQLQARELARKRREEEQQERVAGYLLTLLPEERRQLEKNALASGDSFLRNRLQQLERDGDDQMASVYRDKLVSDHVQSLLSTD
ncbi:MAG: replication initiator protein A [Planctomycetaceae bacterium]|nr:replication initiator protein A [Planctomycetales bacterium]MCB9924341.1 replication initiator protein A [Planctomycetaceae bacterium]